MNHHTASIAVSFPRSYFYKTFNHWGATETSLYLLHFFLDETAETVERILREYLEGVSLQQIARGLEADGRLTGAGKTKWRAPSIYKILQKEKYIGDALLTKTYTIDFFKETRGK